MQNYTIKYIFSDETSSAVEVGKKFYAEYLALEKKAALINRRETRRHQSLDKSLEHCWDIADSTVNIENEVERKETIIEIHNALKLLTEKQHTVFISYVVGELSFCEIADKLGISRQMVCKHYLAAVKKLRNILRQ